MMMIIQLDKEFILLEQHNQYQQYRLLHILVELLVALYVLLHKKGYLISVAVWYF